MPDTRSEISEIRKNDYEVSIVFFFENLTRISSSFHTFKIYFPIPTLTLRNFWNKSDSPGKSNYRLRGRMSTRFPPSFLSAAQTRSSLLPGGGGGGGRGRWRHPSPTFGQTLSRPLTSVSLTLAMDREMIFVFHLSFLLI